MLQKKAGRYLPTILMLLLMSSLLYYGTFWKNLDIHSGAQIDSDAAKYECYAIAFWHGQGALQALPSAQCTFLLHPTIPSLSKTQILQSMQRYGLPQALIQFVAGQASTQPFQALPHEYPLLTLLPFSLGLTAPYDWYLVAFVLWMLLIAALVYFVLKRFSSNGAAYAFAFYMAVGCWATGAGRFDIVPAALTLFAILCAERTKWKWAFVLLAIATLLKFYPVVLLIPFLIAQQTQSPERRFAWRRFAPLGAFILTCIVVTGVSLALSVEGTLGPLGYFSTRPIQVESSLASMVWLLSTILKLPLHYLFSFGSRNVISTLSPAVTLMGTTLLIAGLLYTCWLQWRAKINLATACLLMLLILVLTGKVFSAQYLIWIAPLVAYVGKNNWKWLVGWGSVSFVTTLIYPFLYEQGNISFSLPPFHQTVFVRNLLLLLFICALLYTVTRNKRMKALESEDIQIVT